MINKLFANIFLTLHTQHTYKRILLSRWDRVDSTWNRVMQTANTDPEFELVTIRVTTSDNVGWNWYTADKCTTDPLQGYISLRELCRTAETATAFMVSCVSLAVIEAPSVPKLGCVKWYLFLFLRRRISDYWSHQHPLSCFSCNVLANTRMGSHYECSKVINTAH